MAIPRDDLLHAFDERSANSPLVVVTGDGGVGKSQLVKDALTGRRGGRRCYWWSFYNSVLHRVEESPPATPAVRALPPRYGESSRAALVGFLGWASPDSPVPAADSQPWDLARAAAAVLRDTEVCLVLDGAECVHDPHRDGGTGPADPAIADLIARLSLLSSARGTCVLTHRDPILVPDAWRFPVDLLSRDEIAAYLGSLGVGVTFTPGELDRRIELSGRQAIVWRAIAALLEVKASGGRLQPKPLAWLGPAVSNEGPLGTVVDALEGEVGDDPEWGWWLVRLSGFFDRPARRDELEIVAREFGVSASLPTADRVRTVAQNLDKLGFAVLQGDLDNYVVDVHQTVRDRYATRLRTGHPRQWRAGHRKLAQKLWRERRPTRNRPLDTVAHLSEDLLVHQRGVHHLGQSRVEGDGARALEPMATSLAAWFKSYWLSQDGSRARAATHHGLVDADLFFQRRFQAAWPFKMAAPDDVSLEVRAIHALIKFYPARNAWHVADLRRAQEEFFEAAERLLDLGWVASAAHAWRHRSECCGVLGLIDEAVSYGIFARHLWLSQRGRGAPRPDRVGDYFLVDLSGTRAEPVGVYADATLGRAYHFAGKTELAGRLFDTVGAEAGTFPYLAAVFWYWRTDWRLDAIRGAGGEAAELHRIAEENERIYQDATGTSDGQPLRPLDEGLYRLVRCHVLARLALFDPTVRRRHLRAVLGPEGSTAGVWEARRQLELSHQRPWAVVGHLECARVYLAAGRVEEAGEALAAAEHVVLLNRPDVVPLRPGPMADGILWAYLVDLRLLQGQLCAARLRADQADARLADAIRIMSAIGYHRRDADARWLGAEIALARLLRPVFESAWGELVGVRSDSGSAGLDYGRELAHTAVNGLDPRGEVSSDRTEHQRGRHGSEPAGLFTPDDRRAVERLLQPTLESLTGSVSAAVEHLVRDGYERPVAFGLVRSFVLAVLERDPAQALLDMDELAPPPRRNGRGVRPPTPPPGVLDELEAMADECHAALQPTLRRFEAILRRLANTAFPSFAENKRLALWVNETAQKLDAQLFVRALQADIGPVTLRCKNPKGSVSGSFQPVRGGDSRTPVSSQTAFPLLVTTPRRPRLLEPASQLTEDDEGTGESHQAVVQTDSVFVPGGHPAELLDPGKRPLDHVPPAVPPHPPSVVRRRLGPVLPGRG